MFSETALKFAFIGVIRGIVLHWSGEEKQLPMRKCHSLKTKKAPEALQLPEPICGGGRSSHALSRRHTLGRARFRGRCASRRHSPRHADVSVSWRDRPDRYRSGSFE